MKNKGRKFSSTQLANMLMTLIGEVCPIGETYADYDRYENLIQLEGVIDILLDEVERVGKCSDRPEFSMSKAGKQAVSWFSETQSWIDDITSTYKKGEEKGKETFND